jgi:hypothetical protein
MGIKRKVVTRKSRRYSHKNLKKLKGGYDAPKVAILFGGRIKGYDTVKDNLKRIKDKYNPTVFCSLNKVTKSNYIKGFCEFMGISDDRLHLEKTPPHPDFMNQVNIANSLKGKWGDGVALDSLYSYHFQMQKVFKMLEDYQKKNNIHFDIILYYRADIQTTEELIFKTPIKDMTIYVPENTPSCDWGGLCNYFAYGNFNTMKYYCNINDSVEHMCKEQGTLLYPEGLTKKHMENSHITVERFPYIHTLTESRHKPHSNANIE